MTDTYQKLYQGQLTTGATTLYSAITASGTILKHISVINVTSGVVQFQLFRDGIASTNAITPYWPVSASGAYEWDGTMALGNGDTLNGLASAVSAITVTIDGDVVS